MRLPTCGILIFAFSGSHSIYPTHPSEIRSGIQNLTWVWYWSGVNPSVGEGEKTGNPKRIKRSGVRGRVFNRKPNLIDSSQSHGSKDGKIMIIFLYLTHVYLLYVMLHISDSLT